MKDGGPAFPLDTEERFISQFSRDGQSIHMRPHPGMSLRQWYAGMAMAQIFIKPLLNVGAERIEIDWGNLDIGGDRVKEIVDYSAALAFQFADAMIAEGEKK